jgi:hypothetical protein
MSTIFNQGALDANHKDRLTISQRIGLLPLILVGGIFILLGALMAASLVQFVHSVISHTFQGDILAGGIGAVLFGGVFPIFIFWLAYVVGGKRLIDLITGKVSQVEGRGDKYSGGGSGKGGSTQRVLYYSVGDEKFQIAFYGTWKKLPSETMVRAYYTPLSKTLVNVEPIHSQSGTAKRDLEFDALHILEEIEQKAKKQK